MKDFNLEDGEVYEVTYNHKELLVTLAMYDEDLNIFVTESGSIIKMAYVVDALEA